MCPRPLILLAGAIWVAAILAPAGAHAQTSGQADEEEAAAVAEMSAPDCGSEIVKSTGGSWSCTFADDFKGDELDRGKWSPMRTATSGYSHGYECYIDDPSTIAVRDGFLQLTARKLDEAHSCAGYPTRYVSGMVLTKGKFAQTYGRFEARIKFPTGSGFHGAWWMWPEEMRYGRQSGEIDIAEHWGVYPNVVSPYVHIIGSQGEERGRGAYCWVADPGGSFHTYAVEWTRPGRMVFLYDGKPCMTFENWKPSGPLAYPQPFDRPFFMILTLALQYGVVNESSPFPATMTVDYVRAWR